MRLELTRPNGHYPLKVARLPIPPLLHLFTQITFLRAQNRTRTCTSLNTRTWNERVYHSATWALQITAFERKTRLELATPTLARLCSTNWAISAFVSQIRHFRLRSLRKSKLFHSLARKFRIHISQHRCVFRLTGAKVVQFFKPAKFLRYFLQYFLQNFLSPNK